MPILLDEETINLRIRTKLAETNSDGERIYKLTGKQVDQIKPLFERIMHEERNKNISAKTQISAIDDIIYGLSNKETVEKIFRDNSDNKHMTYYDVWLSEGESEVILNILNEYGLGADVLRGVQLKDIPRSPHPLNPDVEIYQKIKSYGETSLEVEEFIIYYKGQPIYKFNKEEGSNVIHNEEKVIQRNENFKNTRSRYTGKTVYGDYTVNTFVNKNGKVSVRYEKGTIIDGVNVGGRFVKGALL